ncbi:nuclease-related domain-containing protein [Frankia sp. AgB32]|uniref:nuclease-related domain-containing protein n=1 Tax=Frankia sp. AgB32 TaxID=631119 RepID=UPI00200FE707|nr:nuclease-related domain-containing protein [Frankia sp. AgB32]MCK9897656.1 NERD domain-containing protein [Frankia sp. AgB32]
MATITRPTMTRVGRPGHSLQTEYQRARENQALVRRDRLARQVPRIAVRAAVVGLVLALVIAFGLGQPAVAIAVFFVVFLAWPAGIVAASFGTAPDIEFLREGAEAERKTAKAIARLRRHGYLILHDRAVPYSEATIGHLLVGPGGVMVLGSDNSKGTVRYTKGGAVCDGESLKPVIDRASWLGGEVRNQVRAALPMLKIPVIPVLVMVEANVLWSDGALDGVTIISIKDAANFIRKKPGRLNPGEVRQIIAASERLFPAYSANRLAEQVSVDRDQWLALMDALRTIRERDGDASELLDRLAQIEADLGRQADVGARAGMPLAVPATSAPVPATAAPGGAAAAPEPSDEPPADAGPIASIGLTPAPDAVARPRRGRILAAVRPPRETAEQADSGAANDDPTDPPKDDPPAAGA